MYADDVDITAALVKCALEPDTWSFMVDSDHKKRRQSQNGLIIKLNGAPAAVLCQSKASFVTFASERIDEAHADMSSGAVEIYAVGNTALDIMGLSYVAEEMGNYDLPLHTGNGQRCRQDILPGDRPQNETETNLLPPRVGYGTTQQGHNVSCACGQREKRRRQFHQNTGKGTIRDGPYQDYGGEQCSP